MIVIDGLSLMGRFAYMLMCVEAYLVNMYPERDWQVLAKAFWQFSCWTVSDWYYFYRELKPDVILHGGDYTRDVQDVFTLDEYNTLIEQYKSITEGDLDDPNDELCMILNIPFELIDEYDCAIPRSFSEQKQWAFTASIGLTNKIEKILTDHHITLPDIHRLDFLTIEDGDIWGPHFDGEALSIILNKQ